MKKVVAVIPARYQASRFPAKLMQKLGNKTVILTTYQNVLATGLFDEVFVATDSEIIFNEIIDNGGRVVMTGNHETGSDRIAEAVKDIDCDIVVNVQGDEPFLKKEPLAQLIEVFEKDRERQEVSLASLKIKLVEKEEIENVNNVKVITDNEGFALYFSRSVIPYPREADEVTYHKHIGVYAFRKKALLDFAQLPMRALEKAEKIECIRYLEYGMKIKMIETKFIGIGIDTPEDLEKARNILIENKYKL